MFVFPCPMNISFNTHLCFFISHKITKQVQILHLINTAQSSTFQFEYNSTQYLQKYIQTAPGIINSRTDVAQLAVTLYPVWHLRNVHLEMETEPNRWETVKQNHSNSWAPRALNLISTLSNMLIPNEGKLQCYLFTFYLDIYGILAKKSRSLRMQSFPKVRTR